MTIRKVNFSARQKVAASDLNNLGDYPRQSNDVIVANLFSNLKYFSGFVGAKTGATEVTFTPGHLWVGGKVYEAPSDTVINVIEGGLYMPVATRRYLTIYAQGAETLAGIEDRSFLIDPTTNETASQPTPTVSQRIASLGVQSGTENASPQKPAQPVGTTPVAYVLLDVNGVVSVEMATLYRVTSIENLKEMVGIINVWRDEIGQTLNTIFSELGAIKAKIPPNLYSWMQSVEERLSRIENLLRRPPTAIEVFTDRYLTGDLTDTAAAGYAARIDRGLRFPIGTVTRGALALLNPFDPSVKKIGNVYLPTWSSETIRQSIETPDDHLSINQYTVVNKTRVQKMMSRTVTEYGSWWDLKFDGFPQAPPTSQFQFNSKIPLAGDELAAFIARARYANAGNSEYFEFKRAGDPEVYAFNILNLNVPGALDQSTDFSIQQVRTRTIEEPYWETVTKDATINGSQIAQTFKNVTDGWLTGLSIPFTQTGSTGDVHLFICETKGGKPVKDQVIGRAVIDADDLIIGENKFVFEDPIYTVGGRDLAWILVSTGNHFVGVRKEDKYKAGSLFYLSDSSEWIAAQNTGDACFKMYYGTFDKTRIEVSLVSLQRGDGIGRITINAAQHEPPGTKLTFETQLAGKWYQISEGEANALTGFPTLVPLRMVFTGTRDLMPGIDFSQTEYTLGKDAGTLTHQSTNIELDAATDDVEVRLHIEGWLSAVHTIDASLILPGPTTVNNDGSWVIQPDPEDANSVVAIGKFTLTADATFALRITGTTSDAAKPFVITNRVLASMPA